MSDIEDWGRAEVTSKCVGAMTCRVLAPEIFREVVARSKPALGPGNFSEVGKDIASAEEYTAVRQAIFSCPFKAIRWSRQPRVRLEQLPPLYEGFPKRIEDNVYFMGHPDANTFACAGFFIRHEGHNILIDPPIAHPKLLEAVQQMGGVQHLCFTHVDHTGNATAWYEATKASRLMHKDDMVEAENKYTPFPVTKGFEHLLELKAGETTALEGLAEFQIIHTPGHTAGSIMFLYKKKFLFTGDSLHYSAVKGHLVAARVQCWQSWELQTQSLERLPQDFQWVLPGHGDWRRFESPGAARASLDRCVWWMKRQGRGRTWLPWYVIWIECRKLPPGLFTWLADSFLMTQGAKDSLPNWTLPSWFTSLVLLIPPAMLLFCAMPWTTLKRALPL
ncbi:unnamed protein product [Effrenium voratum]|nr:unnamed protein product [Effrenium voratum]